MKGYEQITNPATGRKVSVYGKTGQKIINSYINHAQSGGDATPHMGARPARRTQNITPEILAASQRQLADRSQGGQPVRNDPAAQHGHDQGAGPFQAVSSLELKMVGPVAQNLRPRARGTRAERDAGIERGQPVGPYWPTIVGTGGAPDRDLLDSPSMAQILQTNTTNKTKDQVNFLSEAGTVSQAEKDAIEEAMRIGDGSGFIDFPGLKLLFRGVLYDFLMRDGKIIFQLEKNDDVHSKCQTRGSRRLDGVIHYTKSKGGKMVLTKIDLERPNCWPRRLPNTNPVSRISL